MTLTQNQEDDKTKTFTENEVSAESENTNTHHKSAVSANKGKEEGAISSTAKGPVVINMESNKYQTRSKQYSEVTNNMPSFWVQFNLTEGNRLPPGGTPLYYEPDRNFFVRFVFAIVLFMLILTSGFVMMVYMTNLRGMFLRFGIVALIVGMIGMLIINYAMMCSACTRVPPCNFICLFLAVCFMSLIAAYITARYKTQVILIALLATTITVMVCLCLACTSFDFTKYMLYVIVIAAAFSALALIVSMTMMFTNTRFKPAIIVILVVGTLINVVILVMELQMILGGRTVELGEDDYALAAFMLYTSIIDIFLKLVQLLGMLGDD